MGCAVRGGDTPIAVCPQLFPTFKSMRQLLLILSGILIAFATCAQPLPQHDAMCTLITRYFNEQDVDNLYGLTNDKFRERISKETFTTLATRNLFPMGKIQKTEFIDINDGVSAYKAVCASATMELLLSVDDKGKLDRFQFKPFKPRVASKAALVPTSNSMRTAADSQVDVAARSYIQKVNTAGLCVGILKDGKATTYGYGTTDKKKELLPDENTVFEIGSVSKTFTAVLLAWYAQQKKLNLTDPITQYLPAPAASNKALEGITLTMLSNHTSGLPRMPSNIAATMTDVQNPYKNYDRAQLFSYLSTCKTDTTPGSNYSYSNLAVGTLGVILERVSGKTYNDMVQEVICEPLRMGSTGQYLTKDMEQRFAKVYNEQGNVTAAWDVDALAGAGALRSTVHDMLLYARANMQPGKDALSGAIKLTHGLTNTQTMNVGLGWHVTTMKGEEVFWHSGGTFGSSSYIMIVPRSGVAVVVLSNCGETVENVARKIFSNML